MNRYRNFQAIAVLMMIFSFIACNNSTETPPIVKSTTMTPNGGFEYRFGDATKPPPYHRSFTISIKPGMVRLEISSYGDILLKDSSVLTEAQYFDFVSKVTALKVSLKKENPSNDCTGGATDYLALYTDTPDELRGYLYHCGSTDFGNLEGEVEKCIQLFHDMVPDLGKKLDSTRAQE